MDPPPIDWPFPAFTFFFFFFNDTATTEIYTLSLHDALPISLPRVRLVDMGQQPRKAVFSPPLIDRKSTRLNSSHANISYAVFCLKKKKHTSELQSPKYIVSQLMFRTHYRFNRNLSTAAAMTT